MITHVFVSGPYAHPDPVDNTRNAILAARDIRAAGFTPYLPHTTLLWHIVDPHPVEYWYQLDLEWLERCDALIRLPGASAGADAEVAFAAERGIPVFLSMDSLIRGSRVVLDVPEGPDE
jgi:nucleoside 2-deoxyribosyltransferase